MKRRGRPNRRPQREGPPSWPGRRGRVRVLIEHPEPVVRDVVERALHERGYAVLCCGGPQPGRDGAVSCPLLHQEHCLAIDGADVIVNGLPLTWPINRMILHRTRTQHPELPIILEAPQHIVDERSDGRADARLYPLTLDGLTTLIDELIAR